MTESIRDKGTYITVDGRPAVRFIRRYSHSQQRVWEAVTDPEQLSTWYPATVSYEPRVGGTIRFVEDQYSMDLTGTVLAYDPPATFAFTWGENEVRLAVEADGPEAAILTLIDVLDAENSAARNAAGWDVCLRELDNVVHAIPTAGPHADDAEPWQPIYESYIADGLPHGAPVPDLGT